MRRLRFAMAPFVQLLFLLKTLNKRMHPATKALLLLLLGASATVALAAAGETSNKRDLVVQAAKTFSDEWAAGNVDGVLSVYADDAREFYSFFTLDGKENIRKYVESTCHNNFYYTL